MDILGYTVSPTRTSRHVVTRQCRACRDVT